MSTLLITFTNDDTLNDGSPLVLTKSFSDKAAVLDEILRLVRLIDDRAVESSGPQAVTAIGLSRLGYFATTGRMWQMLKDGVGGDTVVNTVEFLGYCGGDGVQVHIEHLPAEGWQDGGTDKFECHADGEGGFSEAVEYMEDQLAAEQFVQAERIREQSVA